MTLTTGRLLGQDTQEAAQSVPRKATGLTHVGFHHVSEERKKNIFLLFKEKKGGWGVRK